MNFLSVGSQSSRLRGYEYYLQGMVLSVTQTDETKYKGQVKGSKDNVYDVMIDIAHPRKSLCNCPMANGKTTLCKHKIAMYFAVNPDGDEATVREYESYGSVEEYKREKLYERYWSRVNGMSKSELKEALLQAWMELTELENKNR